jgi:copper chaperone CopZ
MRKYSLFLFVNLFVLGINAQIKNIKTEQFQISGNCNSAKQLIEKAGNNNRVSKVDYNSTTQIASISYDEKKTSSNEVLKNIALAGFDNAEYMAPDEAYMKLDKTCQYARAKKMKEENHHDMNHSSSNQSENNQTQNQLNKVFDSYFKLKDGFVQADKTVISKQTEQLKQAVSTVEMEKLSHKTHLVWMDVLNKLEKITSQLSQEKNIDKQRELFAQLSEPLYKLTKVAELKYTVYYQNCPMYKGGANWLSKDSDIKNPFYGSMMLTCGNTVEELKNK